MLPVSSPRTAFVQPPPQVIQKQICHGLGPSHRKHGTGVVHQGHGDSEVGVVTSLILAVAIPSLLTVVIRYLTELVPASAVLSPASYTQSNALYDSIPSACMGIRTGT